MMPAWNAEKYIGEAIKSCQDQTYGNWELCVVDDGSTDETARIVFEASLKDNRIRLELMNHAGCPTARNEALLMASGDIIARQDADDLQDPTRLDKQVLYLLDHEDIDIVTCRMNWLMHGELSLRQAMGMNVKSYMEGKSGGPVCASIVAWKYVYDKVGGFDPDQLAGSDGAWNFRAIIANMAWGFIAEPLYTYRRHAEQITKRLSREQRATHDEARKRYYELWRQRTEDNF
jgi:glycosyltransferase involved in cell wall biosynthesis